MIDIGKIKIRKFIGVSAGAFLSIFVLSGLDLNIIRNINDFALKNNSKYPIDKIMIKICWELLPDNIHEIINGKLSILISKSVMSNKRQKYINKFKSKIHLLKVLHASSYIPGITSNNFNGINIDGERYFDGSFSNFTPIKFNNNLPQLIFQTWNVDYSISNTFSFKDQFPEFIIFKGLIEFEKFLINLEQNKFEENKIFPIKWIESINTINKYKKIKSISNNKYNHIKEYLILKKKTKMENNFIKIFLLFFLTIYEVIYLLSQKNINTS